MRDYILNEKSRDKYSISQLMEIHQRYMDLTYAALVVGCELPMYSLKCQDYIDKGDGCLQQIIDDLLEKDFFINHTNYLKIIRDRKNNQVQQSAKLIALNEWMQTFPSPEEARNHPSLPPSLQTSIR